jgi:hypothetical protein
VQIISSDSEDDTSDDDAPTRKSRLAAERASETMEEELGDYSPPNARVVFIPLVARMVAKFISPAYAFFSEPTAKEIGGRRCHLFHCSGPGCKVIIRRFVDTDSSTGNLIKHVKACRRWGNEVYESAAAAGNAKTAREKVIMPF